MNNYVNGSDIMVFVDGKPTLAAKSHKASYKSKTKEVTTKDTESSLYGTKTVTGISVSISVDALVAVDESTGVSADALLAQLKKAETVKLKYGKKNDTSGNYEEGFFVIDSIDITSPAGDNATYTASFSNSGKVKTMNNGVEVV